MSLRTISLSSLCALASLACDAPPAEPTRSAAPGDPLAAAARPGPAPPADDARAHYVRALELESTGRLQDARAEVDRALAAGAGRDATLLAARLAIARNDLDTAAALLAPFAADSKDALVHHNLGLIAQQRGQPDGARAAFLAAVTADPTYAPARLHLALLLADAGLAEDARHHARTFLELSPGDPRAPELRARLGLADPDAPPELGTTPTPTPPDPATGLRDPFGTRKPTDAGLKNPFDQASKTPDSGLKDPFAKPTRPKDTALRPKNPFERRPKKPAEPQDLEPLDPFAKK